ncbi:hypothetical protein Dimus_006870 [Dionaea muscipula]
MGVHVKQEVLDSFVLASQRRAQNQPSTAPIGVIDLSSSESSVSRDSDDEGEGEGEDAALGKRPRVPEGNETASSSGKKRKVGDASRVVLPVGFLDPIVPDSPLALPTLPPAVSSPSVGAGKQRSSESRGATCKQFWKAGDYVGAPSGDWDLQTGGMDHVRVHPKFLHSNATSHKWALGAFAELLDNALDEVCNGATYANLDMLLNKKDGNRMLLIEDNGGGMDPDKMRQCLSLGYSAKSKLANTIGQYGNGFKTSTMRLGADVIVFSRCRGKSGRRPTQSIGLLSYTFLRSTGKEDIVVPILDYERKGDEWEKMIRPSPGDWSRNVETIVQWSPFSSEANLLQQFNLMKDHGTRIIIFNLWEDDQGHLELDFDSDPSDIQIRGVNRDEKNIQMAKEFPNSRHFLTYRHSLRSYVSILYLRLPPIFRIILRGKDVEHHNIVNDMMMSTKITYRPQAGAENTQDRDPNLVAVVTIGFVKDAESHIDVQGFNVYHKNRLIKPFWRVWNAAGSDGRGVIGVLEANFVEPAHDKQGFERTTVLARLETKLLQLQKTYWTSNCHLIGYAPRGRNRKEMTDDPEYLAEKSPDCVPNVNASSRTKRKSGLDNSGKIYSKGKASGSRQNGVSRLYSKGESGTKVFNKFSRRSGSEEQPSPCSSGHSDDAVLEMHERRVNGNSSERLKTSGIHCFQTALPEDGVSEAGHSLSLDAQNLLDKLKEENQQLKERLNKEQDIFGDLQCELQSERDKCKQLEIKLKEAQRKVEDLSKEQETLINIFSEERDRRDLEEENLRKKLKEASNTIQDLLSKSRLRER